MSVLDHYPVLDSISEKNLKLVDVLVEGGVLLSGLKLNAPSISHLTKNIVKKSDRFVDLISGQPGPGGLSSDIDGFKEGFCVIAATVHGQSSYRPEDPNFAISDEIIEANAGYGPYVIEKIKLLVNEKEVNEAIQLAAQNQKFSADVCKDLIVNEVEAYIFHMIIACYHNELEINPFFARMLQFFQAGGLPCGWLHGDPEPANMTEQSVADSMYVLHFG